jgi:uncharacterized protein YecE (DUF72 family)
VRLLWEPRGPWPEDTVRETCAAGGVTHVVDPFVTRALTADPTYLRLHGRGSAYNAYTDAELVSLRAQIPASGDTYVMFNNIPRTRDAPRLRALLSGDGRT